MNRRNAQLILAFVNAIIILTAIYLIRGFTPPVSSQNQPEPTSTIPTTPTATAKPTSTPIIVVSSTVDVESLHAQVEQLRLDVDEYKSENSQQQKEIGNIENRFTLIEEIITEDAPKALQLTSLKNKLDNITSELERMTGSYIAIISLIIALATGNLFGSLFLRRQNDAMEKNNFSELSEQVKQLNSKIEILAKQNSQTQETSLAKLNEQVQQLNVQIEKLNRQNSNKYSPLE